jgi:hypothetical protein
MLNEKCGRVETYQWAFAPNSVQIMYSLIEDPAKTRPRKQKRQVSFKAGLPFSYCWD